MLQLAGVVTNFTVMFLLNQVWWTTIIVICDSTALTFACTLTLVLTLTFTWPISEPHPHTSTQLGSPGIDSLLARHFRILFEKYTDKRFARFVFQFSRKSRVKREKYIKLHFKFSLLKWFRNNPHYSLARAARRITEFCSWSFDLISHTNQHLCKACC